MSDSLPHCVEVPVIEAGLDIVLVYLPETAVYAHSMPKYFENFVKI